MRTAICCLAGLLFFAVGCNDNDERLRVANQQLASVQAENQALKTKLATAESELDTTRKQVAILRRSRTEVVETPFTRTDHQQIHEPQAPDRPRVTAAPGVPYTPPSYTPTPEQRAPRYIAVSQAAKNLCIDRWPDSYRMQESCFDKQAAAEKELPTLKGPNSMSLEGVERVNAVMRVDCIKKEFEAFSGVRR